MVFNYNRKIESESDTAPFSGTRKSKIFILAGNSSPTKIEENLVEEPGKQPTPFEKMAETDHMELILLSKIGEMTQLFAVIRVLALSKGKQILSDWL